MAMEKMGISLVVNGAWQFARDLGHVASGLVNYQRAVQRAQQTNIQYAISSAMLDKAFITNSASLTKYSNQITRFTADVNKAFINVAKTKGSGGTSALLSQYNIKDIDQLRNAIAMLNSIKIFPKDTKVLEDFLTKLETGAVGAKKYKDTLIQLKAALSHLASTQATTGILDLRKQQLGDPEPGGFSALFNVASLAMGKFMIALDVVKLGINTAVSAFKVLYGVIYSIGSAVFSVITFFGKLAFSLISLPFKFVINAFSSVFESVKRIFEISIGMGLENVLMSLASKARALGRAILESASDFQYLEIRLQGLVANEIFESNISSAKDFSSALVSATEPTKELFDWVQKLGVTSPYKAQDIANVLTLAKSYEFTVEESKKLTESVVTFASAMGLEDVAMKRIIENFGQMKAQGKMTGTEIRDLARGAFVPVTRVFQQMALSAEKAKESLALMTPDSRKQMELTKPEDFAKLKGLADLAGKTAAELKELGSTGAIDVNYFFTAFEDVVANRFPGALDRLNKSIKVAGSNVEDFFEAMIGFRILKPVLDEIGGAVNSVIASMFTKENIKRADMIGQMFANIAEAVFGLSGRLNKLISNSLPNTGKEFDKLLKKFGDLAKLVKDFSLGNFSKKEQTGPKGKMDWIKSVAPSLAEVKKAFDDAIPGSSIFLSPFLTVIDWWNNNGATLLLNIKSPADAIKVVEEAFKLFKDTFVNETWPAILGAVNTYGPLIVAGINDIVQNGLDVLSSKIQEIVGQNSDIQLVFDTLKKLSTYITEPSTNKTFDMTTGLYSSEKDIAGSSLITSLTALKTRAMEIATELKDEVGQILINFVTDTLEGKVRPWIETNLFQFGPRLTEISIGINNLGKSLKDFNLNNPEDFNKFIDGLSEKAETLGKVGIVLLNIADSISRIVSISIKIYSMVKATMFPLNSLIMELFDFSNLDVLVGVTSFVDTVLAGIDTLLSGMQKGVDFLITNSKETLKKALANYSSHSEERSQKNGASLYTDFMYAYPAVDDKGIAGSTKTTPRMTEATQPSWVEYGISMVKTILDSISTGVTNFIKNDAPAIIEGIQTQIQSIISQLQSSMTTAFSNPVSSEVTVDSTQVDGGSTQVPGTTPPPGAGTGLGILSFLIPSIDITTALQPIFNTVILAIASFSKTALAEFTKSRDAIALVADALKSVKSWADRALTSLASMISYAAANPIVITTIYQTEGQASSGGGGGSSNPYDKKLDKEALGGFLPAGYPSWVGEFGKEIFVPKVPGWIVSSSSARNALTLGARTLSPSMATGGNVTYNTNNFYGPQQFTVPSETSIYDFARSSSMVMG